MRALPDGAKASSFVKTYMPSFITQKAMCTRHRRTVEAGDMCKGESEGGCYTQVHITCTCMHVCLHRLGCVYIVRSTALGNGHHALSCLSTAAQCNYMSLLVQMRQVGCSNCSSTTCQDPACLALLVRLTNI